MAISGVTEPAEERRRLATSDITQPTAPTNVDQNRPKAWSAPPVASSSSIYPNTMKKC